MIFMRFSIFSNLSGEKWCVMGNHYVRWQTKRKIYTGMYVDEILSVYLSSIKIKPSSFKHPWLQANLLHQSTKLNQINFWLTYCINQVKLNQINSWLTLQSYGFKRTSIYVRTSNGIRLYALRFTLFASSHTIRFTTKINYSAEEYTL